ncbi:MAG: aspartate aminotransferase family protein [Akkermansiaceae bacterium]
MLPHLLTDIPGPSSLDLAGELKSFECRNTTYTASDWPVFWQRAEGTNVWDADENRFLDLTSAFGVAGLGHGWSAVAMREQSEHLIHGMGDVHPTALKIDVCRKLSAMTFERWCGEVGKTILSNSGFEAIESALKTARVATGKSGIVTFRDSYHGLGYGALLAGGFDKFRVPVSDQLADLRTVLDFPTSPDDLERLTAQLAQLDNESTGAVLVEPIQGRGGKRVPPSDFLKTLRTWCDENGALLIFDEIFTGFNRTGKLFACDWDAVIPDIICLGKSLSGGYPISACVGKSSIMDAWPESTGEALHTSTFLGNPVGCAMASVSLDEHAKVETSATVTSAGDWLLKLLENINSPFVREVRGRGLMLGVELEQPDGAPAGDLSGKILTTMLQRGIIMLADGLHGNVLSLTPPFIISEEEMQFAVAELESCLDDLLSKP